MVAIKSSLIALSSLLAFVTSAPSALNLRDTTVNEPAVSSDGGTPVPIAGSVNNGNQYDSQSSSYGSQSSGSGGYGGNSNSGSYSSSSSNSGNYGSSSSNSGSYGGSGSSGSYGGSGGSGGNYGNSYSSSSVSAYEATSTTSMYEPPMSTSSSSSMYEPPMSTSSSSSMYEPPMTTSSTMMEEATSTSMYESTSTSSASNSYSSPSYGSGSSNYNNGGYNDCVNQCVASYGAPASMYTPPASSGDSSSGSGSGKTWTVIVAPEQGVLRFVPFAVNASVGDTVRFVWGANVHTVTKSSVLEVCNKTSDAPFTSGIQNKTFTFDQVVNDTNPTFFYCGVPSHCQKGMFGIINPPNAAGSASSVSMMMPSAVANSSDLSAQYAYTQKQTGGSEAASNWGMYMDISKISADPAAQEQIYQNVMYTQLTMAQNPSMLTDGVLTPVGGTGLSVPDDITKITAASSTTPSSGSAGGSVVSSSTNAQGVSNSEATAAAKSAAVPRSVASSSGAIAISVVIAAFFAL